MIEIGSKVKHLNFPQTGTVVAFTEYWGYPAAIINYDEYKGNGFTTRAHTTTNLINELTTI